MQLRSLALLTLALDALLAGATRVHHRPVRFKTKQHLVHAVGGARRRALEPRARGMIQMAYFTNWGIYGRNFRAHSSVRDVVSALTLRRADGHRRDDAHARVVLVCGCVARYGRAEAQRHVRGHRQALPRRQLE